MVPFQDVINGQKAKSSTSRCAGGLDMTCAEGAPGLRCGAGRGLPVLLVLTGPGL